MTRNTHDLELDHHGSMPAASIPLPRAMGGQPRGTPLSTALENWRGSELLVADGIGDPGTGPTPLWTEAGTDYVFAD